MLERTNTGAGAARKSNLASTSSVELPSCGDVLL